MGRVLEVMIAILMLRFCNWNDIDMNALVLYLGAILGFFTLDVLYYKFYNYNKNVII